MKSLIVIVLYLAVIVQCQEMVFYEWNGPAYKGQMFGKVYDRQDWLGVLDFSVYGWLQRDSMGTCDESYCTIFQLTQNKDEDFGYNKKDGDNVISLFTKKQEYFASTYNAGKNPEIHNKTITQQKIDFGQWCFFYVGFNGVKQTKLFYLECPSGSRIVYTTKLSHYYSKYYKLYVGSSPKLGYFPGKLQRVHIHAGPGSFRYENFGLISGENPSSYLISCSILYSECNFKGVGVQVCGENLFTEDTTVVKSIQVPLGKKFTIHHKTNRKRLTLTETNKCINNKLYKAINQKPVYKMKQSAALRKITHQN